MKPMSQPRARPRRHTLASPRPAGYSQRMSGRSTRRASIALLASLLQLIAGVESAMGLSLCIAEDGHASLELAHADETCALEVERHHPELDEIFPAGEAVLEEYVRERRFPLDRPGLLEAHNPVRR